MECLFISLNYRERKRYVSSKHGCFVTAAATSSHFGCFVAMHDEPSIFGCRLYLVHPFSLCVEFLRQAVAKHLHLSSPFRVLFVSSMRSCRAC